MADTVLAAQRQMIQVLQKSLRQLRQVLGLGVQEFADCLGITRQTVNNLETGRAIMSPMQYIAVAAVIDNCVHNNPELFPVVATILQTRDTSPFKIFDVIEERSLLRKWFSSFSEKMNFDAATERALGPYGNFGFIADNYKIFLDDSILMCESFQRDAELLLLAMNTGKNSFIVPLAAVTTLQALAANVDKKTCLAAKSSLKFLAHLQKEGLLDLRGSAEDGTVLETICSVFKNFRHLYRLCLITQDPQLAKEILPLNEHCEQENGGFKILLLYYDIHDKLQPWVKGDISKKTPNGEQKPESEVDILGKAVAGWDQI